MLRHLLDTLLREGSLTGIFPGGRRVTYGHGEPHLTLRLHDRRAIAELVLDPDLKLGELYTDGRLTIEDGDIVELLSLLMRNLALAPLTGLHRTSRWLRTVLRPLLQFNPMSRAKQNVAHHYDLSDELYARFLDRDRQYSCAYFPHGDETLEEAQAAKKRHVAAKLLLDRPGLKVLDIGCGWGGLALDLARDAGVHSASRCPKSRSRSRGSAARKRVSRTAAVSNSPITARSVAPTTASCPSACSSMSACRIMRSSSPKPATC